MRRRLVSPDLSKYLTVGEAADLLGVSASTLRYWDQTGKFKPGCRHPMNGYRLYCRKDVEDLLTRLRGVEGSPPV